MDPKDEFVSITAVHPRMLQMTKPNDRPLFGENNEVDAVHRRFMPSTQPDEKLAQENNDTRKDVTITAPKPSSPEGSNSTNSSKNGSNNNVIPGVNIKSSSLAQ